ncbi:MAG: hypothetical protein N2747_09345 [Chitinophagaceae bacterium]|nr:hypothetical protein [Chitinophagaceae bacterium]
MKNLRHLFFGTVLFLGNYSFSQGNQLPPVNLPDYNRPKLFNGLPDRIPVSVVDLSRWMEAPVGTRITFNLTENNTANFSGDVVSTGLQNEKAQSVVIRSVNFQGACFSISRVIQEDGSELYRGRILSFRHGDAYVLEKTDNQYWLIKKGFYDLVNE